MVKAGQQSRRRLANAATRRELALEMMLAGRTYQQIADALDYSDKGTAHRAVTTALAECAERTKELADLARPIVLERLEMLWAPQFKLARKGDPKAAELCLKMLDRFSKIHGLDRITVDHTVTTRTELDAEIEALVQKLSTATPTDRATTKES
ncbi:hypothetical protein IU459_11955 [Nocardia amamiensis]|uniref:Helix-turn-helix domain-containing protein n=1 Tax=Nocardia amamiensis TaxID=404578 RepID=A0ABS0CNP2_9NOCA|nr:hypothetical protein [Nocardia amamiensis]MBF6298255.1 hypothetical protein [Nocardia amamiensis]